MKTETVNSLVAHVISECKAINTEDRYNDMLNECYSFESVGGVFSSMSPASVLKECDPTAYRCGLNDWMDGEGWLEIESEYYDSDDVEKARDEFIDELESQLSDLDSELDDAKEALEDREPNSFAEQLEVDRITAAMTAKQAEIDEAKDYVF